jgi:hypothetical protein
VNCALIYSNGSRLEFISDIPNTEAIVFNGAPEGVITTVEVGGCTNQLCQPLKVARGVTPQFQPFSLKGETL